MTSSITVPGISVESISYLHEEALAAGSDHAVVTAELRVGDDQGHCMIGSTIWKFLLKRKMNDQGILLVGSLLLGLFDETDSLRYVGGTRLTQVEGKRVLKELESIVQEPGFVRRNSGRFISSFPEVWTPVMPVIVVEVEYDRFTGGHFRHGTKFLVWRPDKSARDCLLKV